MVKVLVLGGGGFGDKSKCNDILTRHIKRLETEIWESSFNLLASSEFRLSY